MESNDDTTSSNAADNSSTSSNQAVAIIGFYHNVNSLPFPQKVYHMVQSPEHAGVIEWAENGESFHIRDRVVFIRDILPRYFARKLIIHTFSLSLL